MHILHFNVFNYFLNLIDTDENWEMPVFPFTTNDASNKTEYNALQDPLAVDYTEETIATDNGVDDLSVEKIVDNLADDSTVELEYDLRTNIIAAIDDLEATYSDYIRNLVVFGNFFSF